ncbi:MAG: DUF1989 domain-containing protein [Candidatus Dormibacteria bacterium]
MHDAFNLLFGTVGEMHMFTLAENQEEVDGMELVFEQTVAPKDGLAVPVKRGQHLRVIDLEGRQVVDTAFFNLDNLRERLSTSYSRTRYIPKPGTSYAPRDKLMEGDILLSTICRPMMTIVEETPEPKGIHDSHNRMCNRFLYENYGRKESRDGCHEIISKAVAGYGILPEDIPDTMDLFMNYQHDCALGHWVIKTPVSKPGDYIEFRAEMDCLAAFSNCPEDELTDCNDRHCTPVKIEIYNP